MPGPPVAVCEGDIVRVDLRNTLATDTTTLHFHGMQFIIKTRTALIAL